MPWNPFHSSTSERFSPCFPCGLGEPWSSQPTGTARQVNRLEQWKGEAASVKIVLGSWWELRLCDWMWLTVCLFTTIIITIYYHHDHIFFDFHTTIILTSMWFTCIIVYGSRYGYGSIPMNIPFLVGYSHPSIPAILMWTKKGYYWFWHTAILLPNVMVWCLISSRSSATWTGCGGALRERETGSGGVH